MATILHKHFLSNPQAPPKPADAEAAARGLDAWRRECADQGGDGPNPGALADDPCGAAILRALFGNSPYLTACALREPGYLASLLAAGPDGAFTKLIGRLGADLERAPVDDDLAGVGRLLRVARRRASLLIGAAEITRFWSTERAAAAQSRFAEQAIGAAVGCLLRHAAGAGELGLADLADPAAESGLILLALGKLGGGELNYSSDVDLIVLYDEQRVDYRGRHAAGDFFIRLTKRLVELLEARTPEGYVFRVDLRLRPDPGVTPLALPALAAETYYESLGQNWERAAMIKARPVAGDRRAAERFLAAIEPFTWRKSLDFATIRDIHSIKRQIHAHRGGGAIRVRGHNVKLGRGGIREIEFFAQTQQLIWGGRLRDLRARATCAALAALARHRRISEQAKADLVGGYWFLRRIENHLQMIEDRQVHTLPASEEGLARLATFLGYDGAEALAAALTETLGRVAEHYSELFEEAPALVAPTAGGGSLVFTGVEDDPETLRTLAGMGFKRAESVSATIRRWHRGRLRATRSTRARQILTDLIPALLAAFARTANPDDAFVKFDQFLGNLPAGVQLFSLFQAHPKLLDLVAEIMGTAPRLSAYLSRNAHLLDAVLSERFFAPPPGRAALAAALDRELAHARDFQDVIDITRRWSSEIKFQVSVQHLQGLIDTEVASPALSDVADLLVAATLRAVAAGFAGKYGRIAGSALAVIGFGKLGSRLMTRGSDLDLVFVYDRGDGDGHADGAHSLDPASYYTRLCQRLITAISAQTGHGLLYEVDMRLRPMGRDGPLACDIAGLERYYAEDAWTWELMALTRARVVTAPPALGRRLERLFRTALTRRRDPGRLARDVADMRRRVEAEHRTGEPWDIKYVRGGLLDVEFIAQYLQLRDAADDPGLLDVDTLRALRRAAQAGRLAGEAAEQLIAAGRLYLNVQAIMRISLAGNFDKTAAPEGLRHILARAGDAVDFADLKAKLMAAQRRVRAHYGALIDAPAAAYAAQYPDDNESRRHGQ